MPLYDPEEQCFVECAAGEVRNPLQYCNCVTEEKFEAMFCAEPCIIGEAVISRFTDALNLAGLDLF